MNEEEQHYVKREVVATILLLIIIVAVIGTYTVLRMTDSQQTQPETIQAPSVSLTILPPESGEGVETIAADQ